MNVAIVVAHPDDAEIWMGGTLLAYRGTKGSELSTIYPLEVTPERRKEALAADSRAIFSDALSEELRRLRPDMVFTHWELDTHRDHHRVFQLVQNTLPELVVFDHIQPRVFSFGTYNNLGRDSSVFTPTDFVDISPFVAAKRERIRLYDSQNPQHWIDMIELATAMWGRQCGVEHAEGFREVPVLGVTRRAVALI